MKEIYLVTKGRYSDYSVYGVFEDKELATEYAEQLSDKYDVARVDTRRVMTSVDLVAPLGFRSFVVKMDIDGNSEISRTDVSEEHKPGYGYAELNFCNNTHTGYYIFIVLTDKGEEGAIKIANERRIQMIANNIWPKKNTPDDPMRYNQFFYEH